MSDQRWTAIRSDAGIQLIREMECEICCKRKKDKCPICRGTKVRATVFDLTPGQALDLRDAINEATR